MRSQLVESTVRSAIQSGLRYETGRVISPLGNTLKPYAMKNGYLGMNISSGGVKIKIPFSRLVCWLVHGPPPSDKHDTDHKDRNKSNNDPSNLAWLLHRDNLENMDNKAAHREAMRRIGVNHRSAKLNDLSVLDIRAAFNGGARIKSLAATHNVSPQAIIGVVYGRSWKHVRNDNVTRFGH